jgi:hypothetical protein
MCFLCVTTLDLCFELLAVETTFSLAGKGLSLLLAAQDDAS